MGVIGKQLNLDRKTEEIILLVLSSCFFLISLIAGYKENGIGGDLIIPIMGVKIHIISTPMWIGCGLLCIMCLQQRYHSIWTNGIWLLAAYFLTAAGTILFFVMYDLGYWWYLTSVVLLLLALSMLYWMILEIYTLRSRIVDAYPEEEERMEMGEWAIMLPIFILMTVISYYFYSKWFLDEEGWFTFGIATNGYLLTQIAIFGIVNYIMYRPHEVFKKYIQETAYERVETTTKVLDKKNQCVKCNNIAEEMRQECPKCGEGERTVYCNMCEIHSISCYKCSNLIILGESCTECNVKNEGIVCIRCSFKGGIREWMSNNG